ncbi:MAG: ATP-binding protein [Betaproteobacteria bacterium]
MKILLVDDSRSASALFENHLHALGHEVCLAENGAVAVAKFCEFAPDLVLMDIEMPVMNGFEATRHIREFETSQKWAWTPILFLTSAGTTDNFVASVEVGGDDLIPKNVAEPVLRAKLKAMSRIASLRQRLLDANYQMEEDLRRREAAETELSSRCAELTELNLKLSEMQAQLIQKEKLASIGQLAAGVAHEINTPLGFILSNVGTLGKYLVNLIKLLNAYESLEPLSPDEKRNSIQALWRELDIDYLQEDAQLLINETKQGVERVKRIVQSLKDFSNINDIQDWQFADLHHGVDCTLSLLASKLQDKVEIIKEYGDLPLVECLPWQLNQVFMNLLENAAHAVDKEHGGITIRSGTINNSVWVEFQDNGCGIPSEIQSKIFDPFFTTKPIGSGSGLGLSISYGIIQGHSGRIEVKSEVGKGSCFRVILPVKR